ncbi:MAG: cytochrome c family protein [Acidobacteriota bacterium]|nr:cytochrome c family protein [Acidobacteriota bacterium]
MLGCLGAVLLFAAPEQPIPFSHKIHAGTLKLKCKMCHPNPDPGETMTIAAAAVCMQCHSAVKTDSAAIQKLSAFAKNGREIPWARVYQIPSFVNFSHKAHLNAGNTCAECHGAVAGSDQLIRETDISMGGCMNCHRAKKASIDCTYCHEPQN